MTQALYKAKIWHSALFGVLSGIIYLTVVHLIVASVTVPVVLYYGVGVMTILGFVAWQWRAVGLVLWLVLTGINLAKLGTTGFFDWPSFVLFSVIMAGPFAFYEGRAFLNKDRQTNEVDA